MELSDEEKKRCEQVFTFIDKDNKGELSKSQLKYALEILGKFPITKKEMTSIYGMGGVDLPSFYSICSKEIDFAKINDSLEKSFEILDTQIME